MFSEKGDTMIPKKITRKNLLDAIKEIDPDNIPSHRKIKKYYLVHNNEQYPPKYTISLANKFANGQELSHKEFSGGWSETNAFLDKRGFVIKGL